MSIFDWLFGKPKSPHFTGVIDDPRTMFEKRTDYLHEERVATGGVADPFGNAQISDSGFYYENQHGTGACVPHAIGLALAIERLSDTKTYARVYPFMPYRMRSNFPQAGSWPVEIFNLYAKYGAPLYGNLPNFDSDAQANGLVITQQMLNDALAFKGKEYYTISVPNNITTIAQVAAQGHAVPITIYANYQEWFPEYPVIIYPGLQKGDKLADVAHEICVLPNSGFTKDGKRYVTVQDSAQFNGIKLRHVSEDFIVARAYGAGYWDTVDIIGGGPRPKYHFSQTLKYGMKSEEVRQMQLLLIAEGCLPADCATGLFAGRTLAGVHAFQNKYAKDILIPISLTAPTDTWGSMCIKKANELCGA